VTGALTDDQLLLRDHARDLLAEACPADLLRAHRHDIGAADALWHLLRAFVPLGLGPVTDLCVFTEELGAVAAPVPFLATAALYAPLLEATGEHDLDPVLDGHATGTVALAGRDGRWRPSAEARKTNVPDAPGVDLVAAVAADGTVTLLAAPPSRRTATIDSTRCLYEVETTGRGIAAGTITRPALAEVLARATVAFTAEAVGTARCLVGTTGSDTAGGVGQAGDLVHTAARALDRGADNRWRAVRAAVTAVTAAVARAAGDAVADARRPGAREVPQRAFLIRRAYGSLALLDPAVRTPAPLPDPPD
jgi:hypothetical protein